jgi:hypothetical protein
MKATVLNFTGDDAIQKGASFEQTLEWLDSNGDPVDLTGLSARMQVRRSVNSPAFVLELTTENGGIVLGGTNGKITMRVSATQSAAIPIAAGVYDLELVNSDGKVTRFVMGDIDFSPEVTR